MLEADARWRSTARIATDLCKGMHVHVYKHYAHTLKKKHSYSQTPAYGEGKLK